MRIREAVGHDETRDGKTLVDWGRRWSCEAYSKETDQLDAAAVLAGAGEGCMAGRAKDVDGWQRQGPS